jgi:hypothetical protein
VITWFHLSGWNMRKGREGIISGSSMETEERGILKLGKRIVWFVTTRGQWKGSFSNIPRFSAITHSNSFPFDVANSWRKTTAVRFGSRHSLEGGERVNYTFETRFKAIWYWSCNPTSIFVSYCKIPRHAPVLPWLLAICRIIHRLKEQYCINPT